MDGQDQKLVSDHIRKSQFSCLIPASFSV